MVAMDRLDEAVGSFEQALFLDPEFVEACYHLGLTFEKVGRKRKAIEYLRRAQKINPKYPGIREKLDALMI